MRADHSHSGLGLVVAAALALSGCSLDGLLLTNLTRKGHQKMPPPAPIHLDGRATDLAGGAVALWLGDSVVFEGHVAADDRFRLSSDGTTAIAGGVLYGHRDGVGALAIIPELPAQTSVLDPAQTLELSQLSPGALALDDTSTTLALLVLARARQQGVGLGAIAPGSMVETLIDLDTRLRAGEPAFAAVAAAVLRVRGAGAKASVAPWQLALSGATLLRDDFALASGVDADGDGHVDGDGGAMEALLTAAASKVVFKACYQPGVIRVVVIARLQSGKNGNCEAYDPFLWADNLPTSAMFITGGVHPDSPRCSASRTTACISDAAIDALNQTLGNWVPNRVRMYDDGTHGDGKAGDSLWTVAFEAPWWDPATAPDGAGLRIAYKFTYGKDGQGWTGAEEFPGNQRILELADVNGDQMVVRLDAFGDETTNKDKANGNFAGCGQVKWPATATAGCLTDSVERAVDLDGDCKVDGWPSPGKSGPLTVPCSDE